MPELSISEMNACTSDPQNLNDVMLEGEAGSGLRGRNNEECIILKARMKQEGGGVKIPQK